MTALEWVMVSSGVLVVVILLARFLAFRVWAEAMAVDLPLGLAEIIGMRLRGTDPAVVVRPAIIAKVAGIPLDLVMLEAHAMAGGRVKQVVYALIEAKKLGVDANLKELAKADLDGRDPLDVVRAQVARQT